MSDFGLGDWLAIGSTLTSAATGLYNTNAQIEDNEASRAFARTENEKARAWQTQEREAQQTWARMMQDRQNAYDTPAAQLKRLEEAGFNPVTFNSQLGSPSANVPSSPSAPSASISSPTGLKAPSLDFDFAQNYLALESMRQDLKRKKLDNADREAEVKANLSKKPAPSYNPLHDSSLGVLLFDDRGNPYYEKDENHIPSYYVDVTPEYNYYEEKRARYRFDFDESIRQSVHNDEVRSLFSETYPILKDMKREELNRLREDIREKQFNNSLLEDEVEMRKKYGISEHDSNIFTALLRASLRNPEGVSNMLSALSQAISLGGREVLYQNYKPILDLFNH